MTTNPLPALNVIGLMSGTSVDSIDAACIRVQLQTDPLALADFTLLGTATQEIPEALRMTLLHVIQQPQVPLETLCRLQVTVGQAFAQAALSLIQKMTDQGITVDLIASHGQTLYHLPPQLQQLGWSLQVGEPAIIAAETGIEVAADFRPADMALGGHGAPLVPFADQLLFQHSEIPRAVQNIGGIANVTAIPAANDTKTPMLAFDTGPGNMVMDTLMTLLYKQPYDEGGQTAKQGTVHPEILASLLEHPYYQEAPPKSTGREVFGRDYATAVLYEWQTKVTHSADLIATVTALTAETIVQAYERFVLPKIAVQEVIVAGGGVYNPVLMDMLQSRLSALGIILKRHEDYGIPSKYKEAIAFALLGYARKMGVPSNMPACTGAQGFISLGGLWQPALSHQAE